MARREPEAQLSLPIPQGAVPSASADARSRQWDETLSAPAPSDDGASHWDERPIALAEGQRLRAVTAAAGRMRIRAGMTVSEARARCAALEVIAWDDVAIHGEITRATAAFLIASPQVTPVAGAPGMWWVGAGGLDALGGERALARTLLRIARLWHPAARVAIASSCVAARAATWADNAGRGEEVAHPASPDGYGFIVPREACAAYLAPAPLGLIPMEEELRQSLVALGLRTVGAFATLAAEEVERRWGSSGLAAWRLARGEDRRRPVLTRVEARRSVTAELAMPAATMEPVLFLVRAALDRLVRELVADGRAAATIAITLTLDDGRGALPSGGVPHTVTREVRPARPLARVAPLFERCRALLDRWTLAAPVAGVMVTIAATAPAAGEQGELLDPAWRDPAAADAAFARLRAELGPNVIVRPIARDEHRPERAGAWVDVEPDAGSRARTATGSSGARSHSALRLLEPPEAVEVECADGAPTALHWRGRRFLVDHAAGPERLSGDWWKDGYARDYWHCESADGEGELVLFLDRAAAGGSRWYVQGWYD